jgi:hypothetical protein
MYRAYMSTQIDVTTNAKYCGYANEGTKSQSEHYHKMMGNAARLPPGLMELECSQSLLLQDSSSAQKITAASKTTCAYTYEKQTREE